MKKLMIVAAAAALSGSVFASDECVACGPDGRAVPGTNPAFYDITLKFKTLGPKSVKCGDCEGICMENANRTFNGIVWTCVNCDDDYPLQIALWEKSTKAQITPDLVYGPHATFSGKWTATANFQVRDGLYELFYPTNGLSVWDSGYDSSVKEDFMQKAKAIGAVDKNGLVDTPHAKWGSGSKDYVYYGNGVYFSVKFDNKAFTVAVPGEFSSEALAEAFAKDYIPEGFEKSDIVRMGYTVTQVKEESFDDCVWATNANWDYAWYRYGKKADKVEACFTFDEGGLNFCAVGFGSFDKKTMMAKSISGNAVGTINPDLICDAGGQILEFCGDFECGPECWGGANAYIIDSDDSNTFASGTWTLKANQKLANKTMLSIVPNSYDYFIDPACVK